jgi:hypothetical protein
MTQEPEHTPIEDGVDDSPQTQPDVDMLPMGDHDDPHPGTGEVGRHH